MKAEHTLTIEKRERTGSRFARRARNEGKLPCVIYGHGAEPVHAALDHKEALRFFEDGERVFKVELPGEKPDTVMLKDLQFDHLGTNVVHCDLVRVNLQEEVEANVHLELDGEPEGLKEPGALLNQPMTELAVRCSVADLPDEIRVDVSKLTMDEPLHAGDIALPSGVTLDMEPDVVVAQILIKKEQEEPEPAEAAAGGEIAGPEVITGKKEGEEAAEGESTGDSAGEPKGDAEQS